MTGTTAVRPLAGGMSRQYRLHLPPASTNATALPVVLNFHGRYGTAQDQESYSGLLPISDREHFLLVSADGTGDPRGWSAGATPPNGVDDVRFVSDLLDTLGQELCIDPGRVYATGFSNGAFMASRLGCEMSDRLAAIAPVGGVDYPATACGGPMPVLAIHGTADPVVPLPGGQVRRWMYPGARAAMAGWAALNHCAPSLRSMAISETMTWDGYQACGAETAMIVVPGATRGGAPGARWASADDISAAK
jgi:polyhydroxybutyrate depolymerase